MDKVEVIRKFMEDRAKTKKENNMKSLPIYASDLSDSKRTKSFLGKEIVDKMIEAELKGDELVIGYFLENSEIGEEDGNRDIRVNG